MTIKNLIQELQKYPEDTKIGSDDGEGFIAFDMRLSYDKTSKHIIIFALGYDNTCEDVPRFYE